MACVAAFCSVDRFCDLEESGDMRSKRPITIPSFCGVGPIHVRCAMGVRWAERGAS